MHAITVDEFDKPGVDYSMIPALATVEGGETPTARAKHAACAFHENIVIYGGCDEKDNLVDEKSSIWLFNPERKAWDSLVPSSAEALPGPCRDAKLFAADKCVILFGGIVGSGSQTTDIWQFDIASRVWSRLPTAPVATSNAALTNGQLWLISGSDHMSSELHHISLFAPAEERAWESFTFPTNPLAPGPRARHEGALIPVTTGWGRNYLVYLLGARHAPSSAISANSPADLSASKDENKWSDTWVLQIPSSDLEAKPSWTLKEAIKPAKIKDAIRSAVGADTGHLSWSEAVVQLPEGQSLEDADKEAHPGSRASFGADIMSNGHSVVLWGGLDEDGKAVGDGWIVKFS